MNKMTPNEILLYLHISVYSVIFREGSSCSRWQQIKRLTAIHYYRGFHQNPHLRAQGTLRKRRQQERKSQMNGEQGSVMQLSKAHLSSQILKQQVKRPTGSASDPLHMCYSFQLKISGTPECKKDWVSVSCVCSWDSFPSGELLDPTPI